MLKTIPIAHVISRLRDFVPVLQSFVAGFKKRIFQNQKTWLKKTWKRGRLTNESSLLKEWQKRGRLTNESSLL